MQNNLIPGELYNLEINKPGFLVGYTEYKTDVSRAYKFSGNFLSAKFLLHLDAIEITDTIEVPQHYYFYGIRKLYFYSFLYKKKIIYIPFERTLISLIEYTPNSNLNLYFNKIS